MDTLAIKLMSLAVHAEELTEEYEAGNLAALDFDITAIRSLLSDPEVAAARAEMDDMALLPLKRKGNDDG